MQVETSSQICQSVCPLGMCVHKSLHVLCPSWCLIALGIGQLYSNMPRHAYIIIMASSPMGIQDVSRMYQAQDIWRGARPAAPARRARSTPRRVWQLSTLATWRARPSTG